jgi:HAD superfamily hydrolase (TIGR01509 family)
VSIRVVIFDFDGIIIDTETPDYEAWREAYEAHGHELGLDVWAEYVGTRAGVWDPLGHLHEKTGGLPDPDAVNTKRKERFHAMVGEQSLMPGVDDYIREIKERGLHLGLASSADRIWVHGHLKTHGLFEAFDVIRTADDVVHAKPAPDLYLEVLDALAVNPREAVAIEDSPHGVSAAKAAGIYCLAVPNPVTANYDLNHADVRVNSLSELPLARLLEWAGEASQ